MKTGAAFFGVSQCGFQYWNHALFDRSFLNFIACGPTLQLGTQRVGEALPADAGNVPVRVEDDGARDIGDGHRVIPAGVDAWYSTLSAVSVMKASSREDRTSVSSCR